MSPFVASQTSLSSPCLQTMAQFENLLNAQDCTLGLCSHLSVDSDVFETCLKDESLFSLGDMLKQHTFALYPERRHWFMPFLMPASSDSHQEHSDVCWWLIDSGASASVVSSRFLSHYDVLHQMKLPTNRNEGFSSASGDVVVPTAAVCIRAHFRMTSIENPRVKVLKECLIASHCGFCCRCSQ